MPTARNGVQILNLLPKNHVLKNTFFNAYKVQKFPIFLLLFCELSVNIFDLKRITIRLKADYNLREFIIMNSWLGFIMNETLCV